MRAELVRELSSDGDLTKQIKDMSGMEVRQKCKDFHHCSFLQNLARKCNQEFLIFRASCTLQ